LNPGVVKSWLGAKYDTTHTKQGDASTPTDAKEMLKLVKRMRLWIG